MSDKAFFSLRDIIHDRSGIYFPDHKKYVLENRLLRHIEDGGFEDYDKYIEFLKFGPPPGRRPGPRRRA